MKLNNDTNYIIKTIGDAHAIWFMASQSFLLLEKPAYYVFKLYFSGGSTEGIIKLCEKRFGKQDSDISLFVKEIIQHIDYYNNSDNIVKITETTSLSQRWEMESEFVSRTYQVEEKIITVNYGSSDLMLTVDPIFAHLKTKSNTTTDIVECFEQKGKLVLKHNGRILDVISVENIAFFTGGIQQLIYSIIYGFSYNDWMCMLHASGVASGGNSIMFSAASGSGKSTISAILKAHGYHYLSDDLIGVDTDGNAYPYPGAISVKEGAVDVLLPYYPELVSISPTTTFINKIVRYLPVFDNCTGFENGFKVKAFVFVEYSTKDSFEFEEIEKKKALQLLLEQSWINPIPEFIESFFSWLEQTTFYRLRYSENQQSLDVVKSIFDKS